MKLKHKIALSAFRRFFISSKHRLFFWKHLYRFLKKKFKRKVKKVVPIGEGSGGKRKKKWKEKMRKKKDYSKL